MSLRAALGRRVVSAATAEEIGQLKAVVIDRPPRRIVSVQVAGSKRKPGLVEWSDLSGFGPDAVMVVSEDGIRGVADEVESGSACGELSLLGARILDDAGDECGVVDDVVFDPTTGVLVGVTAAGAAGGSDTFAADQLLAFGSYALVVRAAT